MFQAGGDKGRAEGGGGRLLCVACACVCVQRVVQYAPANPRICRGARVLCRGAGGVGAWMRGLFRRQRVRVR